MKKYILHIIILLGGLAPLLCMGQTGNFWAFQENKGLDFSVSPPNVIYPNFGRQDGGPSNSSAAISDCDGNVLFYVSADIVHDAFGNVMANGMLANNGDNGSYGNGKSAMTLVPKPGHSYRYLLFYMNVQSLRNTLGVNRFFYAEIDMLANGGLGTVVFKDSLVGNMKIATSNLDVVKHANDTDFWLVTTPNESIFHCYKIDSNGLNQTPVSSVGVSQISWVPFPSIQAETEYYGNTRFTRDGQYLIVTGLVPSQSNASVLRYDFNKTTGQISNPFTLISQSQLPGDHTTSALEISPNNEIAYFTSKDNLTSNGSTTQYLWQVNISNRSTFKTQINSNGNTFSLNLGPDNRVYFVTNLKNPPGLTGWPALHYIPRPNEWGNNMGIGYLDTIPYNELFSLPRAYIPVYDYNFTSTLSGDCVDSVAIHYKGDTTFKQMTLYYGDGDSTLLLQQDLEKNMTFTHRYTSDGKKVITLKLETYFCNSTKYLKDSLYVRLKPDIDSLSIASIAPSCSSDTAELRLHLRSTDSVNIQWSANHLEDYLVPKNDAAAKYFYTSHFDEDTSRQLYVTAKSTNGCVSYDTIDYTPARLRTDTVRYGISGFRDVLFSNGSPQYFICQEDIVQYADSTHDLVNGGLSSVGWQANYANSTAIDLVPKSSNNTYIITDTNSLGCAASDTFMLMLYESPKSDFTLADDSICASEQVLAATNKTTFTDFSKLTTKWLLDDVTTLEASGSLDYTANLATVRTYNVSLVSTSDMGCADTLHKDFVVLANPLASYTWSDSVFCSDGGIVSLASDSIVGFKNSWSLNGAAAVLGSSYSQNKLAVGANTVRFISQDGYGCSDTTAILFTVNQSVKTALSAENDTLCAAQEPIRIGLTANVSDFAGGLTSDVYRDNVFVESKPALFVQDLNYPSDAIGTFLYKVITNSTTKLCADTQQIAITVLESPKNEKLTLDGGTCLGTVFEVFYGLDNEDKLAGSMWTFGDGRTEVDKNNLWHTYTAVGTYDLTIKLALANGCEREIIQSVTVIPPPEVDFSYTLESLRADELILTLVGKSSNQIAEWKWASPIFGNLMGNPIIQNTKDTGFKEITLAIKDIYGCENSTTEVIPVYAEVKFYIPNAFSPNGDGLNDRLTIVPAYFIKQYRIQVYNRWGEKVYDGNDLKEWLPSTTGVYIYTLELVDILNKRRYINGTVTVLE